MKHALGHGDAVIARAATAASLQVRAQLLPVARRDISDDHFVDHFHVSLVAHVAFTVVAAAYASR